MLNEEKHWGGIDKMVILKAKRRQELAKLPFEEKISILLRLQHMARGMSKASGKDSPEPWKCGSAILSS